MSGGPDETEQLLEKLETELFEKQAVVDTRVAREQATLDALTLQNEALEVRRAKAEEALKELEPRRDAMVSQRDELRLRGPRRRPLRAAAWSVFAASLTLGAVVPLVAVQEGAGVLWTLGGEAIALGLGWAAANLWQWSAR